MRSRFVLLFSLMTVAMQADASRPVASITSTSHVLAGLAGEATEPRMMAVLATVTVLLQLVRKYKAAARNRWRMLDVPQQLNGAAPATAER